MFQSYKHPEIRISRGKNDGFQGVFMGNLVVLHGFLIFPVHAHMH